MKVKPFLIQKMRVDQITQSEICVILVVTPDFGGDAESLEVKQE